METLWQDLRYAGRTLRRSPGFTLVAVLTLALGIGATTAIFTVVNSVLLRPLPYAEPEALVQLYHANPADAITTGNISPPDFEDLQRSVPAFEPLAAYWFDPGLSGVNLMGGGEPMRLSTAFVSDEFFPTLGTSAAVGRTLLPEENVPDSDRVIVLSHGLWQSRFGADPSVVGRTVNLDGEPFTVVGVMPRSFQFPSEQVDVWLPLARIGEEMIPRQRGIRYLGVVGRLAPGVGLPTARRITDATLARLEQEYPESNEGWSAATVLPLREVLLGEVRPALLVLLGAVALVLLIACANLANLLLARGTTRGREVAIRAALGAARGRLARQHLTESLLLALLGGALGFALAWVGVEWLVALGAGDLPRADTVRPDTRVAVFTLLVVLFTVALSGLLPALHASRVDAGRVLREGGRTGTEGRGRFGARNGIVVAETALALVLLVGAGLMLKSFWRLINVDPGFRAENVLAFSITPPDTEYEDAVDLIDYRSRIIDRLEQIPGVVAVGGSKTLPLHGGGETSYAFRRGDRPDVEVHPEAGVFMITPDYLRALGIPLLRGRDFTESIERDRLSILVNQALAKQVWPSEDPLGKTLRLGDADLTVVGVVGNVRTEGLTSEPGGALYVSMLGPFSRSTSKLFVRTNADPLAMVGAVRTAIHEVAPNQPISDIATLRQVVSATVARPRLFTTLIALFGAVALVLALLGIYGVISYAVAQRTREIGIRMALGARGSSVLGMVLGRTLALTGCGVLIGIAVALALTRLLASQLYGVSATDPATFAGVALLLMGAALLAAYLPARRATRVDPMIALRAE